MTSGALYHLVTTCFVNYFILGFNLTADGNNKVLDLRNTGLDFGIEVSLVLKLLPIARDLLLNLSLLLESELIPIDFYIEIIGALADNLSSELASTLSTYI